LWRPLLPSGAWLAFLLGWALREPDNAEGLPRDGQILTLIAGLVALRVVWRAGQAAQVRSRPLLGVIGLFRPEIHVEPVAEAALDPSARVAAIAHEDAHVRHQDPLRIWLALLATDLQLGVPASRTRFRSWRHALELARDEEARESGVSGPELAVAILAITRLDHGFSAPAAATLGGDAALLQDRIARLLAPAAPAPQRGPWRRTLGLFLLAGLGSVGVGVVAGEWLVGGALR
jgi:beta-lactamase regulating signal transducer with metallopeptidase domain